MVVKKLAMVARASGGNQKVMIRRGARFSSSPNFMAPAMYRKGRCCLLVTEFPPHTQTTHRHRHRQRQRQRRSHRQRQRLRQTDRQTETHTHTHTHRHADTQTHIHTCTNTHIHTRTHTVIFLSKQDQLPYPRRMAYATADFNLTRIYLYLRGQPCLQ